MCGIAGIVGSSEHVIDAAEVHRMCQTIIHRGPDDEGIYAKGPVGLGMRRLSIIDIAGGHQPIHNEDKSIWIVFNGEIYNFPELRRELEQKGHKFYTNTDTEAIVHLYEDLGADCLKKLRGMFGIALYDERRQYLLLGRDRVGKKPLHYALHDGRLYFGSEIKSILAVAPQLAQVDPQALLRFCHFSYIPDPYTAFRGIQKLSPGHLLEYSKGELRVRQYWDLPSYSDNPADSEEQCLDELERRLAEAVRIRLISDVPLGALLSGGVDSSIVVALMARASASPVKTFSIGFKNEDFNELHYARLVADRFKTDHHEMIVEPKIGETLEKLTGMMEEPFGDSSMIPTYYVSCMARKHVTVALSGDGGDELFAGYDRYAVTLRRRHFDYLPGWLGALYRQHVYHRLPPGFRGRNFAWNVSLKSRDRYLDGILFLPAYHRERPLFSPDFLSSVANQQEILQQFQRYYDRAPAADSLSRLLYLDTKTYLPADILTKVDRMSMATSLEVRAPILDHLFVEWVTSLPVRWKYRHGTRKFILKKLAERLEIPPRLLHRRKQGFSLPLVYWMRQEMKDHLLGILLEPRTLQRGYFNPDAIKALVKQHIGGVCDRSGILWQLLVFELWNRNFMEGSFRAPLDEPTDVNTRDSGEHGEPIEQCATVVKEGSLESSSVAEEKHSRVRLVIVGPSLRKMGGQAVQADLLMRNWQHDSSITATFVPTDPEFPSFISWMESVPLLRTLVRMPIYWGRLWQAVRQADVVHMFSASYWSFLLAPTPAWIISRVHGRKTILNYHSGEARDHLRRSVLSRAVVRRMDKCVVPSAFLQHVFREFDMSAEVVPNLVDLSQIQYRERKPLRPVIICTRGFEPYYAVDDVVRAFAVVQRECAEAKLILVGSGSQERQIRTLIDELRLSNVELVGSVRHDQIGHYYNKADIFVNASILDNTPVSILEAFAAGAPVVSTAPEGIRYLVEHGRTGLLCDLHDWKTLGGNVIALLRDESLALRLARNAYDQSHLYHWNSVRGKWVQLYRSTVFGMTESRGSRRVVTQGVR